MIPAVIKGVVGKYSLYLIPIGALVLVAGTWSVAGWRADAKEKKAVETALAAQLAANELAAAYSIDLESGLQQSHTETREHVRYVTKYIEKRDPDARCLDDDELRVYNANRSQ